MGSQNTYFVCPFHYSNIYLLPRWSSIGWVSTTPRRAWWEMTSAAPTCRTSGPPTAMRRSSTSWSASAAAPCHLTCLPARAPCPSRQDCRSLRHWSKSSMSINRYNCKRSLSINRYDWWYLRHKNSRCNGSLALEWRRLFLIFIS